MKKFKNKYRISSARLQNYDYSSNGTYFVTICTANREPFLGEIVDGKMNFSDIGEIANYCWAQIPNHFQFVILGEWIIMPNHVHGVISIDKNVETQNLASLRKKQNKFGPQSQNLASIIRGFKIGVTKHVRRNTDIFDVWQPRFYDRIVRDENELNRISEYIISNPQNWVKDDYFEINKKAFFLKYTNSCI